VKTLQRRRGWQSRIRAAGEEEEVHAPLQLPPHRPYRWHPAAVVALASLHRREVVQALAKVRPVALAQECLPQGGDQGSAKGRRAELVPAFHHRAGDRASTKARRAALLELDNRASTKARRAALLELDNRASIRGRQVALLVGRGLWGDSQVSTKGPTRWGVRVQAWGRLV
jgi:hypothetical protein